MLELFINSDTKKYFSVSDVIYLLQLMDDIQKQIHKCIKSNDFWPFIEKCFY